MGSPVEPDVYIQNATSSDMVAAVNGVGCAPASTSSKNSTSCNAAFSSALAPTTMIERRQGRQWRNDSRVGASAAATMAATARLSANR